MFNSYKHGKISLENAFVLNIELKFESVDYAKKFYEVMCGNVPDRERVSDFETSYNCDGYLLPLSFGSDSQVELEEIASCINGDINGLIEIAYNPFIYKTYNQ
ncbi:hypothetical protein HN903_03970 [archaeon]|jgi:hypothetical protein|nr:hypothetical protein [archaeon]MBT7128886.1 hypothetical protein [archaeon]